MDQDTEQRIRERAYLLWQKEGSPEGQEGYFWERAVLMHEADARPPIRTPLQSQTEEEARVEQALTESFPASDPPSFTPEGAVQAKEG